MSNVEIIDANAANIGEYGFCGYRSLKHEGYVRKIEWLKKRFPEGMKCRILYSAEDGPVGFIEYIPGEYAWRAVEANGYMVIHCVVIMSRKYKGKGHGSRLVDECLRDAAKQRMHGVAVVTSSGTWMAGKELFLRKGFEVVDEAPPGFELTVKKLKNRAPALRFEQTWEERLKLYGKGLTLIGSDQCPYIVKSMKEIEETAEREYGLSVKVIKLASCEEARKAPCAYGVFSLIYKGRLIAEHPISKRRFTNIMQRLEG